MQTFNVTGTLDWPGCILHCPTTAAALALSILPNTAITSKQLLPVKQYDHCHLPQRAIPPDIMTNANAHTQQSWPLTTSSILLLPTATLRTHGVRSFRAVGCRMPQVQAGIVVALRSLGLDCSLIVQA